jgi:hypothetical protein
MVAPQEKSTNVAAIRQAIRRLESICNRIETSADTSRLLSKCAMEFWMMLHSRFRFAVP